MLETVWQGISGDLRVSVYGLEDDSQSAPAP